MIVESLTNQQAFDIALNGIRGQNYELSRSGERPTDACMYRGVKGLKCAVGHMLPDELYDLSLEGLTVEVIIERQGIKSLFEGVNAKLLNDLQRCHDYLNSPYDRPEKFEKRMGLIAEYYSLKFTELPE